MSETIHDGKLVELTYKVTDRKTGHVLTRVEFPLGYVHGHNEILAPTVHMQLEGKRAGETIEVVIDGNQIFGPRPAWIDSTSTSVRISSPATTSGPHSNCWPPWTMSAKSMPTSGSKIAGAMAGAE